MARDHIITGVDIGSTTLQVAILAFPHTGEPRILTLVSHASAGMRRGLIVSADELAERVSEILHEASLQVGGRIDDVIVGVAGPVIRTQAAEGSIAAGRPDGEITADDVERVLKVAEESLPRNPNRELIHIIPRSFNLDHERGIWDPVGMRSLSLKTFAVLVETSKNYLKALELLAKIARVHIADIVFNPLAAAELVLTPHEREIGTLLVDIGGTSTTYAVFEDGSLQAGGSFALGSRHITSDIGLGFRIEPEMAERLKCEFGTAKSRDVARKDVVALSVEGGGGWPRKVLAEVIEARVREIFEEVEKELKRLGRAGLLPGGCVIYGGGARLEGIQDIARSELRLPSKLANFVMPGEKDPLALDLINAVSVSYWGGKQSSGQTFIYKRKARSAFFRFLKSLLP